MLVSLARASLARDNERERGKEEHQANEAKERTPVTRDREKGRNWTVGRRRRRRKRRKGGGMTRENEKG